jgi:hypothetical protein
MRNAVVREPSADLQPTATTATMRPLMATTGRDGAVLVRTAVRRVH